MRRDPEAELVALALRLAPVRDPRTLAFEVVALLVCNAHLPTTDGKPDTSWRVWGYTSCPDGDIATWTAKPDADPNGPTWGGGSWLPAVPSLTGST